MNRPLSQATAFAPASVGNVGVGYDLLGHVIEGPGDRVTARRSEAPGVIIEPITGLVAELPLEPERNTAGQAVLSLLAAVEADFGMSLTIEKGIPLGSGLGGSAASATAAVVAVNALLSQPLERIELYRHALAGEKVASGSVHGDNVGPQLLGGLVLATPDRLVPVPVPEDLYAAVVHPDCRIDTRDARRVLDRPFAIADIVRQQANLALVLAGCFGNDLALIRSGLADVLVEPHRARSIRGFDTVKQAALDAGALGASISGAGPSLFAWCEGGDAASEAAQAMTGAFARHGLEARAFISPVHCPGARVTAAE